MSKPLILVTNDDGIYFPGIHHLKKAVEDIGDVWVVAPDTEKSAVGHAITISNPLRVSEVAWNDSFFGYAVNGTPADCVKLAISTILPRPPDIVVSGINSGENTATNVLYSGTVSAATEGVIMGVPSVAFSIASFRYRQYGVSQKIIRQLVRDVLENGLPGGTLLNVNIPPLPADEIKGVRLARHGKGRFQEKFEKREDPSGRAYYWLSGKRMSYDTADDMDDVLVKNGFVAVSPIRFDLTDMAFMKALDKWKIEDYEY
jgi:5'-nucleotidase